MPLLFKTLAVLRCFSCVNRVRHKVSGRSGLRSKLGSGGYCIGDTDAQPQALSETECVDQFVAGICSHPPVVSRTVAQTSPNDICPVWPLGA